MMINSVSPAWGDGHVLLPTRPSIIVSHT